MRRGPSSDYETVSLFVILGLLTLLLVLGARWVLFAPATNPTQPAEIRAAKIPGP